MYQSFITTTYCNVLISVSRDGVVLFRSYDLSLQGGVLWGFFIFFFQNSAAQIDWSEHWEVWIKSLRPAFLFCID